MPQGIVKNTGAISCQLVEANICERNPSQKLDKELRRRDSQRESD